MEKSQGVQMTNAAGAREKHDYCKWKGAVVRTRSLVCSGAAE